MIRAVTLLALLPAVAVAQQVRIVPLAPANGMLVRKSMGYNGVRELSDGRVLLSDPQGEQVLLGNFETGTVSAIPADGGGIPYSRPMPPMALGGDSSVVIDGSRFLLFDGAHLVGKLSSRAPIMVAMENRTAEAIDRLGFVTVHAPCGTCDSSAVLRISGTTGAEDTVARLANGVARKDLIWSTSEQAFGADDGWTAIVRLNPYRVDWRAPDGTWTLGAPLPVVQVPLTDREKEAYLKLHARYYADRQKATSNAPPALDSPEWPATIPIVQHGLHATTENGEVVVLRVPSADHPETRYDVIDRPGHLVRQISMPAGESILGFGAHAAYVSARSADSTIVLTRHPWP